MEQKLPPTARAGNICIWLISCLFFIFIISGGVFLVLYMVLPEAKAPVWFPAIGIILVGIPWAFWFMTCFYRTLKRREPNIEMPPARAGAAAGNAPAVSTATDNGQAGGSPVHSGIADEAANTNRKGADVGAQGSSLVSHESEMPLTSSMSCGWR